MLLAHLTPEQARTYVDDGHFVVTLPPRVGAPRTMEPMFPPDQDRQFCLHPGRDSVIFTLRKGMHINQMCTHIYGLKRYPIDDVMLAHKLMLENDPCFLQHAAFAPCVADGHQDPHLRGKYFTPDWANPRRFVLDGRFEFHYPAEPRRFAAMAEEHAIAIRRMGDAFADAARGQEAYFVIPDEVPQFAPAIREVPGALYEGVGVAGGQQRRLNEWGKQLAGEFRAHHGNVEVRPNKVIFEPREAYRFEFEGQVINAQPGDRIEFKLLDVLDRGRGLPPYEIEPVVVQKAARDFRGLGRIGEW